jgi:multidrug efflux pump subunit AcrA (membrane-fusion protein)
MLQPGATAAGGLEQPIRGVVRAVNQAALSTDIPMRIMRQPFREGQNFAKGDVLVEFDCRRQLGELQAVKGSVREAELNVASHLSLDRFKAVGKNDIEIAHARLEKVQGELSALQARVQDCVVIAPYSGLVAESSLRILEYTVPQRSYLSIIQDGKNEIEMIIPSSMLASIAINQSLAFALDELPGVKVTAVVTATGAVVDPVSKTAKIFAAVTWAPSAMTSGMSGTAHFQPRGN